MIVRKSGFDKPRQKGHHGFGMAKSRVVIIRGPGVWTPDGTLDPESVRRMIDRGFRLLTGRADSRESALAVFKPEDRIGIKINTIGGRALSTRPETALSLAQWLSRNGIEGRNITIWDRTNRELREAGYAISTGRDGPRILGTDDARAGYGRVLVSHGEVGSLFSTIQTDAVTASISLAILKDHGLAGITAGMKNYFGAIHNPNKYHDSHCDPYVAEVFDSPQVKEKHRLTIIDALLVQYHRGPSYHPRWAEKNGSLIFSLDPVAADRAGWDLIERLRASKGLPTLGEEGRPPLYLATAEKMGLGRMSPDDIETVTEEMR
jgi:uncharacterized protein (DUF362 family)